MTAMALEMDHQITEMWRAMQRVAASIHGDQVG